MSRSRSSWLRLILLLGCLLPTLLALPACGSADDSAARPAGSSSCASRFSDIPPDDNPRSVRRLVPAGARSAIVCRYFGFPKEGESKKAGTLLGHASVRSKHQMMELVAAFSGLRRASGGVTNCPEDRGAGAYVLFEYADEPPVPVRIKFGGCELVGNGQKGMVYEATARLIHLITSIVPAERGES